MKFAARLFTPTNTTFLPDLVVRAASTETAIGLAGLDEAWDTSHSSCR